MKRLLFSTLFLLAFLTAHAQKEQTVLGDKSWGWTGFWGGYRHQLTQIGDDISYARGAFWGIELGRTVLIGWGRFSLSDRLRWSVVDNQDFDMTWNPFVVHAGFGNHKAIHPQIGFEMGRGRIETASDSDKILVMQPTVGLEINALRWCHIGIDGGYRMIGNSTLPGFDGSSLNGWTAQLTLKFGYSWGKKRDRPDRDNDYKM